MSLEAGYLLTFGVGLSLIHFYVGLLVWSLFRSSKTTLKITKDGFKPFIRDGSLFFYSAATTATAYGRFYQQAPESSVIGGASTSFWAFIIFVLLLCYSVIFYAIVVLCTLSTRVKRLNARSVLSWSLPAVVAAAAYCVLLGLSTAGGAG